MSLLARMASLKEVKDLPPHHGNHRQATRFSQPSLRSRWQIDILKSKITLTYIPNLRKLSGTTNSVHRRCQKYTCEGHKNFAKQHFDSLHKQYLYAFLFHFLFSLKKNVKFFYRNQHFLCVDFVFQHVTQCLLKCKN